MLRLIGTDAFEAIGVCPIECIGVAAPGPRGPVASMVQAAGARRVPGRPWTRRDRRTARAAPARPPASPGASAARHTGRVRSSGAPSPRLARGIVGQDLPPGERGERVGPAHEPDPGDLIDPHVHRPARRVVTEVDVPPPPVGRSSEQRRCRADEVRGPPADAEDEDQQPRPRQLGNQAFQFAGGLADICDRAHLVLLTRVGAVSGWEHGRAASIPGRPQDDQLGRLLLPGL